MIDQDNRYRKELTPRRNNITPNIKGHKVRAQILHQVVHRRLASVVDITVRKPRQPAHTSNRHDLTARLATSFTPLVAFNKQFKERHGSGEDGCDVGFKRVGP